MNQKTLTMGDQNIQFMLVIEPNSGLPAWVTMKDELWVQIVGHGLYDYISDHTIIFRTYKLENPKEFAGTMSATNFDAAILSGETARCRDCAMALKRLIDQDPNCGADATFVCFFSDSSDHCINIMFDGLDCNIGVMI